MNRPSISQPQPFSVVVTAKKKKEGKKPTQEKLVIPQKGPIEGRDEMNLVELPFSLVSYRNNRNIMTIESNWLGIDEDGKRRQFYEVVTGSDKWGLPTFQAEELLIAALELTHRQGFEDRRIHTTKYELLSLMRWPITGQYRKALLNAFGQIVGTTIATNHFWDKTRQLYAEVSFHVIDEYRFYQNEQKRSRAGTPQSVLPLSYFTWGETFWNSLQAGYVKKLDTQTYFSLNSPLARRLYRYADKHLHNGGLEVDLFALASAKLVMSGNYRYPSKIIEKLRPSLDELNGRRLADIRIVKSKGTDSGYKVVIKRASRSSRHGGPRELGADPEGENRLSQGQHAAAEKVNSEEQTMVDQLVGYGITQQVAVRLVRENPATAKHLEVFAWIIQRQPERITSSPAGFLVKMIQEDWCPPEDFAKYQEQEKRRRALEKRQAQLLKLFQQELAQALQDLERLMELPLQDQIAVQLENWKQFVIDYQQGEQPSSAMMARREAELAQELARQSREERLRFKREELIEKYRCQAARQGIGELDWERIPL